MLPALGHTRWTSTTYRRFLLLPRSRFLANSASIGAISKRKVVFLGTPAVAAKCLDILHASSSKEDFSVVAAVTQPPAPVGRHRVLKNSPVHDLALSKGIKVLHPERSGDPEFIEALQSLQPDVCITAAFGQYLPKKFLDIPKFGTINIHPSLLPKYRGASPVQRCLEQGDAATGVTLLFSTKQMDAGPILSQLPYPLTGDEISTDVLNGCFEIGMKELIRLLPSVFDGSAQIVEQDHSAATHAAKVSSEEGLIDFSLVNARSIHNKRRAFAEWPGVYSYFRFHDLEEPHRIKLLSTTVLSDGALSEHNVDRSIPVGEVVWVKSLKMLVVKCAGESFLGISQLQPATRKPMDAPAFINGFRGNLKMTAIMPPPMEKTTAPAAK